MGRGLDLLSTSQTVLTSGVYIDTETGEKGQPLQEKISGRCAYGAPMVALVCGGVATIGYACCNHWDCPACGEKRAKQEYRRIVAGAEAISQEHKLYFWTLTCRGRDCTLEEAELSYYLWTNRLLTNARTKAKRANVYWAYSQVTERQHRTRSHPHSHIFCTFLPDDAVATTDDAGYQVYVSAWFARANYTSGLGSQHKISLVDNPSAVSRYVAKYMFKDTMNEKWPAKWKRVRYSQNWPPLPKFRPDLALVLRTSEVWDTVGKQKVLFTCETSFDYELARHHIGNILPPATD